MAYYTGALPEATNRSDYVLIFELTGDSGELLDLTGALIKFAISDPKTATYLLTASTADGKITIPGPGVFQVLFPAQEMAALCDQQYAVGCNLVINGATEQLIIGTVQVAYGRVPS